MDTPEAWKQIEQRKNAEEVQEPTRHACNGGEEDKHPPVNGMGGTASATRQPLVEVKQLCEEKRGNMEQYD